MAQDLAQHLVDLRRVSLAAKSFPELRLNHREYRLDVAALVVVRLELSLVELVEVIHALPQLDFVGKAVWLALLNHSPRHP